MKNSQSKPARGRVIVVGSSNTDLVVHCAVLPRPGQTVLGQDLLTFAGGKGANQAVAAARAGADVRFIGAFGEDAFGTARRADLEREGIDCSGSVVKNGVPSGVALIGIGAGEGGANAENLIIVAAGANARLTPADVRRGMPKDLGKRPWKDVVLCSLEVPIPAVLEAMKLARARRDGVVVILNPAPFPAAATMKKLLKHPHYVTPNETEFEGIVGAKVASSGAAKTCGRIKTAHFLVTRGPRGVDAYLSGAYHARYAVPPKVKAIDTVGAGDCFNGCLAAAFASHNGSSVVDAAVRFAVIAAALKVTRQGAQAGMPHRAEILKLLKA